MDLNDLLSELWVTTWRAPALPLQPSRQGNLSAFSYLWLLNLPRMPLRTAGAVHDVGLLLWCYQVREHACFLEKNKAIDLQQQRPSLFPLPPSSIQCLPSSCLLPHWYVCAVCGGFRQFLSGWGFFFLYLMQKNLLQTGFLSSSSLRLLSIMKPISA